MPIWSSNCVFSLDVLHSHWITFQRFPEGPGISEHEPNGLWPYMNQTVYGKSWITQMIRTVHVDHRSWTLWFMSNSTFVNPNCHEPNDSWWVSPWADQFMVVWGERFIIIRIVNRLYRILNISHPKYNKDVLLWGTKRFALICFQIEMWISQNIHNSPLIN